MGVLSYVTAACILSAAQSYDIHPMVLAGVMKTEGGRVGQYSENSNGTRDLGPMQINDKVWVGEIAKAFFQGNERAAYHQLLNNGCFNVQAGAWILRKNIDASDGDVAEGVGRYHSWSPKHKEKYKRLFYRNFSELQRRYGNY